MTDTTDTPVQRAASVLAARRKCLACCIAEPTMCGCCYDARAALKAALKVRWVIVRAANFERALLGDWDVGGVRRESDGRYVAWEHGKSLGSFPTMPEARAAVQRAILEAILGESLEASRPRTTPHAITRG